MAELSKPQKLILVRLARGERLRAYPKSHIQGGYWSPSFDDYSSVSLNTLNALIERKLVKQSGSLTIDYTITDSGKVAAEGLE